MRYEQLLARLQNEGTILNEFYAGEKGCRFIQFSIGKEYVAKVAVSDESRREIVENKLGYAQAARCALLKNVFPEVREQGDNYLIVEFLGQPMVEDSLSGKERLDVVLRGLVELYSSTIEGEFGTVQKVRAHELSYLEKYLIPEGLATQEDIVLFERAVKNIPDLKKNTLCTLDFTPDNVFVENGLRYLDPKKDVLGLHCVDLGMLAQCYSIYGLKSAEEFYDGAIKFATGFEAGEELFALGAMRQCILSARFGYARPQNNVSKAKMCMARFRRLCEELA